ncbi:hypothetical protein MSPP1_003559 [Malassezia sp. CBS 17886]|nr:hypothetical protein MSPP1_003559 [Malassezia sp. CBS 17886]
MLPSFPPIGLPPCPLPGKQDTRAFGTAPPRGQTLRRAHSSSSIRSYGDPPATIGVPVPNPQNLVPRERTLKHVRSPSAGSSHIRSPSHELLSSRLLGAAPPAYRHVSSATNAVSLPSQGAPATSSTLVIRPARPDAAPTESVVFAFKPVTEEAYQQLVTSTSASAPLTALLLGANGEVQGFLDLQRTEAPGRRVVQSHVRVGSDATVQPQAPPPPLHTAPLPETPCTPSSGAVHRPGTLRRSSSLRRTPSLRGEQIRKIGVVHAGPMDVGTPAASADTSGWHGASHAGEESSTPQMAHDAHSSKSPPAVPGGAFRHATAGEPGPDADPVFLSTLREWQSQFGSFSDVVSPMESPFTEKPSECDTGDSTSTMSRAVTETSAQDCSIQQHHTDEHYAPTSVARVSQSPGRKSSRLGIFFGKGTRRSGRGADQVSLSSRGHSNEPPDTDGNAPERNGGGPRGRMFRNRGARPGDERHAAEHSSHSHPLHMRKTRTAEVSAVPRRIPEPVVLHPGRTVVGTVSNAPPRPPEVQHHHGFRAFGRRLVHPFGSGATRDQTGRKGHDPPGRGYETMVRRAEEPVSNDHAEGTAAASQHTQPASVEDKTARRVASLSALAQRAEAHADEMA